MHWGSIRPRVFRSVDPLTATSPRLRGEGSYRAWREGLSRFTVMCARVGLRSLFRRRQRTLARRVARRRHGAGGGLDICRVGAFDAVADDGNTPAIGRL